MKYLSVFNELKYTTYKSAIDKLYLLKHTKRAKRMKSHAREFGTGGEKLEDPANYFSDSHPFKIKLKRDRGDEGYFVIDNTYFITGYEISSGLNIIMHSVDDHKISISVQFRESKESKANMYPPWRIDKLEPNQSWGFFNHLVISDYWRGQQDKRDSSWFRFKNRRDAVVFRNFLITHFPGHDMDKIKINDIYKE